MNAPPVEWRSRSSSFESPSTGTEKWDDSTDKSYGTRGGEGTSYRFLVSIHHPAQSHFFRHIIEELHANGHQVRVCVRDKEMASELLTAFGIDHRVLARTRGSLPRTVLTQAAYETRLLREALRFRPDVVTSVGGIEISHVAPLVGAKALAFTDTPNRFAKLITAPSLEATCTPAGCDESVRGERRRYEGYQELAYLHPDRFQPDPTKLRAFGIDPDERIFLVRFVNWQAYHDIDDHGFSAREKRELVSLLNHHGTVYVSCEDPIPPQYENYEVPIPPHLIHDLLAIADMYVGDSGTMATEAAVLGTPAVRVNSSVADSDLENFVELEEEYELLRSFADGESGLEAVDRMLADSDLQSRWTRRREDLLADKVDVTSYAVEQLEGLGYQSRNETHPLYE